jgi:hypothetical protein
MRETELLAEANSSDCLRKPAAGEVQRIPEDLVKLTTLSVIKGEKMGRLFDKFRSGKIGCCRVKKRLPQPGRVSEGELRGAVHQDCAWHLVDLRGIE